MKKHNVNNKLAFQKVAITELNQDTLQEINGGTSTGFTVGTTSVLTSTMTVTVSSDVILIDK